MAASKSKKRKRESIPTTDPAQSARFLETAKKLEVDENGAAFDQVISALLPKTTRKRKKSNS